MGTYEYTENPLQESTVDKRNVKTPKGVLLPPRQRKRDPLRKHALTYLNEKSERETSIKRRELALEERKIELQERRLNLEEAKFELDKQKVAVELEERREHLDLQRKHLEIYLKDKEATMNIIHVQQKLLDTLTKQCNQ
ncbi:hypothetical protein PPYR_00053 [Photinus pyralis]|uniref:Uncharacterized protein n=1 Tax=Photinus pyralis TaxID=7054 RepID=A0A5N4B0K6_PHOPY|nr:uncharacterized protein LOC116160549 [Photinus pyralis]XP_031329648.1 uncharacterized protein LOC116160565 [Photinus pyralis]KAB0803083.1 hypothetical protein PPYR_00053 [Photinus pyralis]